MLSDACHSGPDTAKEKPVPGVPKSRGLMPKAHGEEMLPGIAADCEELEPLFDYFHVQPTIDFCFNGKVPDSMGKVPSDLITV